MKRLMYLTLAGVVAISLSGCLVAESRYLQKVEEADSLTKELGSLKQKHATLTADNTALRLYTTTDVTARRLFTLMHDPQYRLAIAWQNVAYNQPPHPGFYLGEGMAPPPKPNIVVVGANKL